MSDETYIDVQGVQRVADTAVDAATAFAKAFNDLKATLEQHDGCWGNDHIGKSIQQNYVSKANKTRDDTGVVVDNIDTATTTLQQVPAHFQHADGNNATQF